MCEKCEPDHRYVIMKSFSGVPRGVIRTSKKEIISFSDSPPLIITEENQNWPKIKIGYSIYSLVADSL